MQQGPDSHTKYVCIYSEHQNKLITSLEQHSLNSLHKDRHYMGQDCSRMIEIIRITGGRITEVQLYMAARLSALTLSVIKYKSHKRVL